MNILFLTLVNIRSMDERNIYTDLFREFAHQGHKVWIATAAERRTGEQTSLVTESDGVVLRVKTGNIQKTNLVEKGISTVLLESQFISAIRKYLSDVKFDLVIYSTPPVTLAKAVRFVKKRDGAKSYLLLKDIFPQNAVDMGMMTKAGIKSILYHFFRQKEKQLYALSDWIGCMSPANVRFLLEHNPQVSAKKVEVCPNSIEPRDLSLNDEGRRTMRRKYGIPEDKTVFVYGGNLGRPQGIPFIIDCLNSQKDNEKAFFLIVGSGTEYAQLECYVNQSGQANVKLMSQLPREDYDRMVAACDVGLIFLDHRFTIPNFPSRLLSYMQARLPVLACTDANTDVGEIITDGGFGWWCRSDDLEGFCQRVEEALQAPLTEMGSRGAKYLEKNYHVRSGCEIILAHMDV